MHLLYLLACVIKMPPGGANESVADSGEEVATESVAPDSSAGDSTPSESTESEPRESGGDTASLAEPCVPGAPVSDPIPAACGSYSEPQPPGLACDPAWAAEAQPTCTGSEAARLNGAPYATVGGAVDAASECDTVWVCAGTWTGTLRPVASIAIIGLGAADDVVIDAEGAGTVLAVESELEARIAHLTLTGGLSDGYGGGLYAEGPDVVVEDVVLRGNSAAYGGGASLGGWLSSARVEDNSADMGGGLFAYSDLGIVDTTVDRNTGAYGGGIAALGNSVTAYRTRVADNMATRLGGGLYAEFADLRGADFVAEGNVADAGGGVYAIDWDAMPLHLAGITARHNTAEQGGGVTLASSSPPGSGIDIRCSDLDGNVANDAGGGLETLTGNISSISCSVVHGNVATRGGGAWLGWRWFAWQDTDWASAPDDNSPDDIGRDTGGCFLPEGPTSSDDAPC
jgi:hypothetical protein